MMRRVSCLAVASFAVGSAGHAAAEDLSVLAAACSGCHVEGAGEAIPSLAGRDEAELAERLIAYRSDTLEGTIMNRLAKGYTERELRALADYFARLGN